MNELVVTETLRLYGLLLRCFICWTEIHLGKNYCCFVFGNFVLMF